MLFTSESVSRGHPDKVADQISDLVLDTYLEKDPNSHVACETFVTKDFVLIGGEIKSESKIDPKELYKKIRGLINDIGYTKEEYGFAGNYVEIISKLNEQSSDIDMGVSGGKELGAGDQGIMFGYATDENTSFLPQSYYLANEILHECDNIRNNNEGFLRPDAKSQVTIDYSLEGKIEVKKIVLSHQHDPSVSHDELEKFLYKNVISQMIHIDMENVLINPTGRFVIGGPAGDTGLTGRKIIVDTYGGGARHGGGAFSGKDPSKVDRSAAYMARHIAKTIVAYGICRKCEVQLSYGIGIPGPLSIYVNTFNILSYNTERLLEKKVMDHFNLSVSGIIDKFDLKHTKYLPTASYGAFTGDYSWEKIDKTFQF